MLMPIFRTFTAFLLAVLALSGCGGTGTETDCTTSGCTVTFDRGVDAEVSILGVKAKLVGVEGDRATLDVAGQQVTVPVGGSAQAGDLTVRVREVTTEQVVAEISAGGG